jgi:hypothetical protein
VNVQEKIQLPFIIIHTKKDTSINCDMSEDRTEYFFDFSNPFTIHDDKEILRRVFASELNTAAQASGAAGASATTPSGGVAPAGAANTEDAMDVDEPVTNGAGRGGKGTGRGGKAAGRGGRKKKAGAAGKKGGRKTASNIDDDYT